MTDDYSSRMLELTSNRKKILDDGEALLKKKAKELAVEQYFDLDILLNPKIRVVASDKVLKYLDHLSVEKTFYAEYHRTFIEEATEISYLLNSDERDRLLTRTTNGLEQNNEIRSRINEIKILTATKIQGLIEILDSNGVEQEDDPILLGSDQDIEKFDNILHEIESLDNEATRLIALQKERQISSGNFIANLLGFLKR